MDLTFDCGEGGCELGALNIAFLSLTGVPVVGEFAMGFSLYTYCMAESRFIFGSEEGISDVDERCSSSALCL